MKSVLISIQPKWVEKIASCEKTIEVRKGKPNFATPFKCYIYQTKKFVPVDITDGANKYRPFLRQNQGKVIGEFVCDKVIKYECSSDGFGELATTCGTCLTYDEIINYCNGQDLYGWHISNLKIYNKPKELSEFYAKCNIPESKCKLCDNCFDREDSYGRHYAVKKLTRPPQSWCYVERD